MSDLISRQTAIDAVDGEVIVTGRANVEAVLGYINLVADRIKRLPSAEPVRHGKWIPKVIIIGGLKHVSGTKCSVCGEDALNAEGEEFLTDYCPNCGALMDGEVEGRKK